MKKFLFTLIAAACALVAIGAAAQVYKWVDKDGKVQYSDQPPPPDAAKATAQKIDASPPVSAPKPLAEKAKEFDKRKTDAAEKAKKSDADAQVAQQKAANCTQARGNLRVLQDAPKLTRVNKDGEIVFVEDSEREGEMAKAQRSIDEFCK